jgi:biopolymer transport protein TolR
MAINRKSRLVSGINVTPLVDVMLVLLIIFMVAAPMMKEGLPINLPQIEGKALPSETSDITTSIHKNGIIEINGTPVDESRLSLLLSQMKSEQNIENVYLQADKEVSYGYVVKILGEIRKAGLTKVGLVTQPPLITQKR